MDPKLIAAARSALDCVDYTQPSSPTWQAVGALRRSGHRQPVNELRDATRWAAKDHQPLQPDVVARNALAAGRTPYEAATETHRRTGCGLAIAAQLVTNLSEQETP